MEEDLLKLLEVASTQLEIAQTQAWAVRRALSELIVWIHANNTRADGCLPAGITAELTRRIADIIRLIGEQ